MKSSLRSVLSCILLSLATSISFAQENFGEFLDKLRGVFIPDAKPRPVFKLDAEFRFKDPNGFLWAAPAGQEVDGASIPQPFWSLIGGPFEGPYISASVIHDHYCKTKERTAHDTHCNFYYGMRSADVPEWKAKLMHWAVETFGPSWKLDKRVVLRQSCTAVGQATTCSSVPTIEVAMISIPPVDLSDPTVLAAAVSKTNAVARTLLTTRGEFLDVTTAGAVRATPDNIQQNSASYRQVFASKDLSSSTARLGLLSQSAGTSLADVKPWAGNRLPRLSEVVVLTTESVPRIEASAPFKLDPRSKDLVRDRLDIRVLQANTRLGKPD